MPRLLLADAGGFVSELDVHVVADSAGGRQLLEAPRAFRPTSRFAPFRTDCTTRGLSFFRN